MPSSLQHVAYTIAWIAILPIEVEAAIGALDRRHHGHFESIRGDDYTYIGGEINGHNVVIAKLPAGSNYGVGAAAALVGQVKARFENIWFALLVGIAAGLPNLSTTDNDRSRDIRLGDVLVGVPDKSSTGIIHYDLGRDTEAGFETNGRQAEPPAIVRSAIGDIQLIDRPFRAGNGLAVLLEEFYKSVGNDKFDYPGQDHDVLFERQTNDESFSPSNKLVEREKRDDLERTRVWLGRIGSGNTLMRNSQRRDELRDRYDLIGLEMEAAGVMNTVPTGVVRGVCDYGDGHKTKRWQAYAAAVAAVYARAILTGISPRPSLPVNRTTARMTRTQSLSYSLDLSEAPVIEDELFIGRSADLHEMENILLPQSTSFKHRRLVLGGMGGVGKTQLAITYAKQHYHLYDSVFWLNAMSEIVLQQGFRRMAQRILDTEIYRGLDNDQVLFHVTRWLLDAENPRWLLIFDNYDEPDVYDIGKYCPYGAHGSAIITTRLSDQVQGQQLLVRPLKDIEHSLEILATRSKRTNVGSDTYARDLAGRMQGLPLALATAGAFLAKSIWTFERYLEEYEMRWNVSPRRPLQLREYHDRTLYTTWDISYRRLEKEDAGAAQLLKMMAYFDNQQIWFELLHGGIDDHSPDWLMTLVGDPVKFENAMRALVDYCFVEVQLTTQSYTMHVCVHDWTLMGLNHGADMCNYRFAFSCVTKSIVDIDWRTLSYVQHARLVPHAKRLMYRGFEEARKQIIPDQLHQASDIAQLLSRQLQFEDAEVLQAQILAWKEKSLGADDTSTLRTVHDLGNLYCNQGKLAQAEQMITRALVGTEKALGADHYLTLNAVHDLGFLHRDQGKLVEAEQMYLRALAGREKALGMDHNTTLRAVNNLGNIYADQDKLVEAEQMYLRALAGREKALGIDHTSTLSVVNNLGIVYADQGKLAEAEQMYLRALAGYEQVLGAGHTSTLQTVSNLGHLYCDQGKLVEAEQMYLRVLAGKERVFGANHTSTLRTANNLGDLYRTQGKLVEAEQMITRALAGTEKALGAHHTSTLNAVCNLGFLYHDQGKLVETEQMITRALAGYEQALGAGHTSTLQTVSHLGNIYRDQSKLAEAEQMYLRALAGCEQAFGQDHPSTQRVIRKLDRLHNSSSWSRRPELDTSSTNDKIPP